MFALGRHVAILLGTAVLAAALPCVPAMAQAAAADPGAGRRGARAPGDYNLSKRSDADKALRDPYALNEAWYTMPKGRFLGAVSAIGIDKDGSSVWIAERCGGPDVCAGSHVDPIIKFDRNGKIVTMFGHDMINLPHGMYVDRDGNIWVTDQQSSLDVPRRGAAAKPAADAGPVKPTGAQVLKFSPAGKLLLRLGTPGVYGNDESHLSQPSAVVTAPNGDIFVADGHNRPVDNNRIAKFDKTGKFIKAWPTCQRGDPVQVDCGHSLAMDSQGRVFVANRGNNRIDIFDQDGKLLASWAQFGKPSGLFIDKNDILYSCDSQSSIAEGDAFQRGVHVGSAKTGIVTAFIPADRDNPSPWNALTGTFGPEGVAVDEDGRIYVGQVAPNGMGRYTINNNTSLDARREGQ